MTGVRESGEVDHGDPLTLTLAFIERSIGASAMRVSLAHGRFGVWSEVGRREGEEMGVGEDKDEHEAGWLTNRSDGNGMIRLSCLESKFQLRQPVVRRPVAASPSHIIENPCNCNCNLLATLRTATEGPVAISCSPVGLQSFSSPCNWTFKL
jgi:hypothetical protein